MIEFNICPRPNNGGIQSIIIKNVEYNQSDLRTDGTVKRKYGKFKREPKDPFGNKEGWYKIDLNK